MAEIRFPKIEIEPADLDRLDAIVNRFEDAAKNATVNVEGWQKALHERDSDILERNNVIALQEKLLREQRENMKALYEERDALRQRLSEAEDDLIVSDMIEKFEPGTTINIKVMLPGQYIVGWKQGNTQYVPGVPSYYPLSEAVDKAVTNYQDTKASTPQFSIPGDPY